MYDTIIIGGGPAGMAAALTIARSNLHCLIVTNKPGGQLTSINQLDNWPGIPKVSGVKVLENFTEQLAQYANLLEVRGDVRVQSISQSQESSFTVAAKNGETLKAKTVILATGASHASLGIEGEDSLVGRGVSYCGACDVPYFKGKRVAVIGDTPEALNTTELLTSFAHRVYLIQSGTDAPKISTDQYTVIPGAAVLGIIGQNRVTGLRYKDFRGVEKSLELDGVFIQVGTQPNSYLAKELVTLNESGYAIVDPHTMSTSCSGVFAAGDVTDGEYKQVALAASDGMKAGLSAVRFMQGNKSKRSMHD